MTLRPDIGRPTLAFVFRFDLGVPRFAEFIVFLGSCVYPFVCNQIVNVFQFPDQKHTDMDICVCVLFDVAIASRENPTDNIL